MAAMTNRDQAVAITHYFLRKLFDWVHLPWTTTEIRLVEKLIDSLIGAAAERIQQTDGAALLDQLLGNAQPAAPHPAGRGTVKLRRQDFDERPATVHDQVRQDDPQYAEWQRRRRAEETASVGRILGTRR